MVEDAEGGGGMLTLPPSGMQDVGPHDGQASAVAEDGGRGVTTPKASPAGDGAADDGATESGRRRPRKFVKLVTPKATTADVSDRYAYLQLLRLALCLCKPKGTCCDTRTFSN